MPEGLIIALLYIFGAALMIAELFIPAGGLVGVVGLLVVGVGLYMTYEASVMAGWISLLIILVVVPMGTIYAIKNWHRTPVGKRISPPNPHLSADDRMPVDELKEMIGTQGKSLTMLRPVGTCLFNNRRVECKVEYGVLEANTPVKAVRLMDRTVIVRKVDSAEAQGEDTTA
jgi:membrane-bound serine protease (ClpP class)